MEGGLLGAFDQVNPRVDDFDVDLLNSVSIAVPRYIDRNIAQRFQGSASASGQSDDGHSFCLCGFGCFEYVGTVATRGNGEQAISGLAKCLHESGEDLVKSVVVSDARDVAWVAA